MTPNKHIQDNLNNTKKFTGSITDHGKKLATGNALKHGLLAQSLIIRKDPKLLELLMRDLVQALQPHGEMEKILVEKIGGTLWHLRRLIESETRSLWQSLLCTEELLKEKFNKAEAHETSSYELDDDLAFCIAKIASLHKGIYRIDVLNHRIVLCKAVSEEALVRDPEFGLYEKDAKRLLDHVFEYDYEEDTPLCHIRFKQYQFQ
jgi:hypothetical protein